jgi:hypothetical protein
LACDVVDGFGTDGFNVDGFDTVGFNIDGFVGATGDEGDDDVGFV